ncbi:MAG: hypothetical protein HYR89_09120 [Actinobacteria bacterium]|nr:hypothetical protein [Actinomycetota bacterium]
MAPMVAQPCDTGREGEDEPRGDPLGIDGLVQFRAFHSQRSNHFTTCYLPTVGVGECRRFLMLGHLGKSAVRVGATVLAVTLMAGVPAPLPVDAAPVKAKDPGPLEVKGKAPEGRARSADGQLRAVASFGVGRFRAGLDRSGWRGIAGSGAED